MKGYYYDITRMQILIMPEKVYVDLIGKEPYKDVKEIGNYIKCFE